MAALTEALQEGCFFGIWLCSSWRWRDLVKSAGLCCQSETQSRGRDTDADQEGGGLTHTGKTLLPWSCVSKKIKLIPLGPRLVLRFFFLVLEKLRVVIIGAQKRQTESKDDWNKLCDSPLPHLESWKICMYTHGRAGTSTVTWTDVELTLLFAHAGSCSTQISRQWTFPPTLAYFDLKHVKSVTETVKGCSISKIQETNTSCGHLQMTPRRSANCSLFRFPFEAL